MKFNQLTVNSSQCLYIDHTFFLKKLIKNSISIIASLLRKKKICKGGLSEATKRGGKLDSFFTYFKYQPKWLNAN